MIKKLSPKLGGEEDINIDVAFFDKINEIIDVVNKSQSDFEETEIAIKQGGYSHLGKEEVPAKEVAKEIDTAIDKEYDEKMPYDTAFISQNILKNYRIYRKEGEK